MPVVKLWSPVTFSGMPTYRSAVVAKGEAAVTVVVVPLAAAVGVPTAALVSVSPMAQALSRRATVGAVAAAPEPRNGTRRVSVGLKPPMLSTAISSAPV